jgi:hypothetical protein
MADSWWQERLTKTRELVIAYEDAILAISTGGATVSYWLDTGQTMQKVTKEDLDRLNTTLEQLLNRVAVLEARCNRSNTIVMRPGF